MRESETERRKLGDLSREAFDLGLLAGDQWYGLSSQVWDVALVHSAKRICTYQVPQLQPRL